MRKLSETQIKSSSQVLVLFDEALDGDKLLQSPEILALVKHFFGKVELSLVKIDDSETLHDWFRDAQYKSDRQESGMIYPVKARFDDLTLATHSDQFYGPLSVQVFTPEEAIFDVLTITCQWYDGLFRNDDYVVGAIVDVEDLDKITHTH